MRKAGGARAFWWAFFMIASLAACGAYAAICRSFDTPSYARVGLFLLMGVSGLAMVFLMRPVRCWKRSLCVIWIPAILMRLFLLPTAPSDDVNRYLWEGRLVAEGMNPYRATADDPMWLAHRDRYWEAMNHKDQPTAYPPLVLGVFALVTQIAYHPMAMKLCFVGADLFTLAGVLLLLRGRGLAAGFAGFYAFNPIILLAYAGEAHFDSLMVAPLVWALCASQTGKTYGAVALASLASGIKWISLPLIPFFARGRLLVHGLLAVAVLVVPALVIWDSLHNLGQGLFQFGTSRSFNGPVYQGLQALGLPRLGVTAIVGLLLAGIVFWRWLKRAEAPIDSSLRWILGSLLVLSPTVHFWYLAWMLPFVCLRPSMPWLMFSLSGGGYFFVWTNAAQGAWELHPWQSLVFWAPFLMACAYEIWSTRGRVLFPAKRSGPGSHGSIAAVLPTLNVADRIEGALRSIERQSLPPQEVILVDADSTDGTVERARRFDLPVRVIQSERGRGQQIAAGMGAARSDWVVVLHADAELNFDSLAQIAAAARANPDLLGGALGQRFEEAPPSLLPIEVLNDLRALFTRTAFGDQTQFFHRQTALDHELMPLQPLMEDVESSWRIRERGTFLYLGQPATVCHRRWRSEDWLQRFILVMRLVTRYRTARLRGRAAASALSDEMYAEYYNDRK